MQYANIFGKDPRAKKNVIQMPNSIFKIFRTFWIWIIRKSLAFHFYLSILVCVIQICKFTQSSIQLNVWCVLCVCASICHLIECRMFVLQFNSEFMLDVSWRMSYQSKCNSQSVNEADSWLPLYALAVKRITSLSIIKIPKQHSKFNSKKI